MTSLESLLTNALAARADMIDSAHETAFRLFNGFLEGQPELVVDVYARTAVLHNYANPPERAATSIASAQAWVQTTLPWVDTILAKARNAPDPATRQGMIVFGSRLARRVREHGVWYALDLRLNQDASLYLDTRNLRRWALDNLAGLTVLNTFAYTGSLGVAARAGGAARVIHLDLHRPFLNVAKASYSLNGWPIDQADFQASDFWQRIGHYKKAGARVDCVFVDPPLFAETSAGRVDLVGNSARVINKVRPLINHNGYLVTINNALFVAGAEYLRSLETLCADGYLSVEHLIDVPPDFTGYPGTVAGTQPTDPAPFNHSTKIAVLRVRRKDGES